MARFIDPCVHILPVSCSFARTLLAATKARFFISFVASLYEGLPYGKDKPISSHFPASVGLPGPLSQPNKEVCGHATALSPLGSAKGIARCFFLVLLFHRWYPLLLMSREYYLYCNGPGIDAGLLVMCPDTTHPLPNFQLDAHGHVHFLECHTAFVLVFEVLKL